MVIIRLLGCLIFYWVFVVGQESDMRRPVWNIAHMVNAIDQADYYLNKGANSIEFDLWFDEGGNVVFTYHGVPCDCFRSCLRYEKVEDYLDYMRQLTTPGDPKFREQLVLLFLDLKVKSLSSAAKYRAGSSVAKKLVRYYWRNGSSGARAHVLLSIPAVAHVNFIKGFRNALREENNYQQYEDKIGYDFSGNEDLDLISYVLKSENITKHVWQGDGITNCLPRGTGRLREAVWTRDQPGLTYIEKVYWWTVDKESTMRTVLRLNADGMITNYPERFVDVLREREFSGKFRMATIKDDPWSKHPLMTAALYAKDEVMTARGGRIRSIDVRFDHEEDELLYNC